MIIVNPLETNKQ